MAQIGVCKFFNHDRGFGFLQVEGGARDIFIHARAVQEAGLPELREGDRVEFVSAPGRNGRDEARPVRMLDDGSGGAPRYGD